MGWIHASDYDEREPISAPSSSLEDIEHTVFVGDWAPKGAKHFIKRNPWPMEPEASKIHTKEDFKKFKQAIRDIEHIRADEGKQYKEEHLGVKRVVLTYQPKTPWEYFALAYSLSRIYEVAIKLVYISDYPELGNIWDIMNS